MTHLAAVLTGDLIASTSASVDQVEASMAQIADLAARIGKNTRFTRYRGDGWQIYIDDPGLGLWAMLLIATSLRATELIDRHKKVTTLLDTRMALGIGHTYGGSADSLVTAGGSAFVSSGRALDSLIAPNRMAIAGEGVDRMHQRLIALLDERISNWSPLQAEVATMILDAEDRPTQADMAAHLHISRQAIAARIHAAGIPQIEAAHQDFFHVFHRNGSADV
jgi:hypothetical protein